MKSVPFPSHFSTPEDRLVREAERHAITGLGPTRWRELEDSGLAPKRVSLTGSKAVAWKLSDLRAWRDSRKPAKGAA